MLFDFRNNSVHLHAVSFDASHCDEYIDWRRYRVLWRSDGAQRVRVATRKDNQRASIPVELEFDTFTAD